jgi:hypothetical protein
MKKSQVRFTTQEKFSILREIDLIGFEAVLKKYKLNVETPVRWQKKLKGSKAGNSIQFVKAKQSKKRNSKTTSRKPLVNEKEEDLLRLVASLIVQIVLKEDSPDRWFY